ncbi:MAG TPA: MFS transporter [Noviherbaspirillum sp.]
MQASASVSPAPVASDSAVTSVVVSASRRLPLALLRPLALPVLFIIFGIIMGSWAGRIPALRDGVQLSHTALSFVLLCGGLGAVISYPLSARLMSTLGGRKTLLLAGVALLIDLVGIGLAPSVPLLMLAVLMLGVTASCFDVAINAVATRFEKTSGRSQLSRLHGWGCGGGLLGATLGSVMAGMQVAPAAHFMMIAPVLLLVLWLGFELLEPDADTVQQIEKKKFALPRGPLALLGALGFLAAMSEGSVADWGGVFLKDHFNASDALAPLALAAFSITMLAVRLCGDRLKEKFGAHRLICAGASVSAAGLLFAVFAPNAYLALAGFAAAGFGIAVVFPFVFSAAGRQGPVALAGVATMAYSGSLVGPPVIGAIAHGLGMQAAIGFIGLLSVAIVVVANRTALLK